MTLEDYDMAIRAIYRAQRELERAQIASLGGGLSDADQEFKVELAIAQMKLSAALRIAFANERALMQGEDA